jgi:tetratricopeptide (TPR) repeat protein
MRYFSCLIPLLLVGNLLCQPNPPAFSPATQLQQLTTQLQQSPDDQALREKIIALAMTLHPGPGTPDAATMAEGAAEYAFKNAKSEGDYSKAAKQFEKALLLAPWLATDYFNCGVAHEKAGENKEAIRCFNFYLLAAPNASDAQATKKRIGGLQYAAQESEDEANKPRKEAAEREAAQKASDERAGFTDNMDGTVTDHKTRLMWQQDDDGSRRTWGDSVGYCRGLSLAGHSDWHLPSKEELASFGANTGSRSQEVSTTAFTMAARKYFPSARGFYYWSSTEDGAVYALRFFGADGSLESGKKSFLYYARCVRRGW